MYFSVSKSFYKLRYHVWRANRIFCNNHKENLEGFNSMFNSDKFLPESGLSGKITLLKDVQITTASSNIILSYNLQILVYFSTY